MLISYKVCQIEKNMEKCKTRKPVKFFLSFERKLEGRLDKTTKHHDLQFVEHGVWLSQLLWQWFIIIYVVRIPIEASI